MDTNENFKNERRIVQSAARAKPLLNKLMCGSEKENHKKMLSRLIAKLESPTINLLMDRYAQLLQQYELEKLLLGDVRI